MNFFEFQQVYKDRGKKRNKSRTREVNITCHGLTSILFYLPKRDLQLPRVNSRWLLFTCPPMRFCWCRAVQKLQSRFWQSPSHLLLPVFLLCARTAFMRLSFFVRLVVSRPRLKLPRTLPLCLRLKFVIKDGQHFCMIIFCFNTQKLTWQKSSKIVHLPPSFYSTDVY